MKPSPQTHRTTNYPSIEAYMLPKVFFGLRKQIPVPACLARNTPLKANGWNLKITHLPYIGFWVPPLGDVLQTNSMLISFLIHFRTDICHCGKKGSLCSPNLGSFPIALQGNSQPSPIYLPSAPSKNSSWVSVPPPSTSSISNNSSIPCKALAHSPSLSLSLSLCGNDKTTLAINWTK